jgi:hypothetical protein
MEDCWLLILPLVILFTGVVTMLETPEKIGDQEEDNRGWIFQNLFRMKKGSEYMKGTSLQVDAPPSFILKIYVCLETADNTGSTHSYCLHCFQTILIVLHSLRSLEQLSNILYEIFVGIHSQTLRH